MKLKNLILLTSFLMASSQVDAQFNKFKSRTNFKAGNEEAEDFDEPVEEDFDEPSEDDGEDGASVSQLKKRLGNRPRARRRGRSDDDRRGSGAGISDTASGGSGSSDIFGRTEKDTKINVIKDKRFVNLNPETAFGPEVITSFDFPNISLVELTKHMQKLTGINLILDKDLKGKISIMAPTAITVGDAWRAFLTALNSNGYTLVKSGKFYKIVQARDIRYTPTKIYTGAYTPDTENYVMRIIPLKNINSTEVTRSFRPFMSRYGRIIDIKQTNTIIVQDTGTNIQRLLRLIKFIDVPGYEESLQIIPVENSSAQEIAKLLDKILKGKGGSAGKSRSSSKNNSEENISKIIAEPRTNSIIAMANAQGAEQLRRLIQKLDVKLVSGRGGQVHVFYLKYADATKIATTLTSLVSGNQRRAGGATRGAGSRLSRNNNASATESLFNDTVKITADEDNNALVITASPTDYGTVKDVIRKLDIPRDQVYVEGMIMETTVSKGNNWGVSYLGQYGSGNARRAGFAGGADLQGLLTNNITNLSGLFVGAGLGKTFDLNVGNTTVQVNTINGLISAIAQSSSTNVLATPQILALDNEEAEFEVGEQVPTTEATNTANGSTQVSNRLQKVALNLKIKPQINKVTRMIKLKITQKIDDFSNRSSGTSAAGGVATTTRTANTTVFVRDQDTIAMGGLMRDRENFIESKVPLLGDIPVLGWLFKNKSKTRDKVNLLFFLTPRIIAPYAKAAAATTKDAINRRILHLKDDLGEKDNFKNTMKGLFDKVNKQQEGPLFDADDTGGYKEQNDGPGIGENDPENAPNYQKIFQNVSTKAAGVKK